VFWARSDEQTRQPFDYVWQFFMVLGDLQTWPMGTRTYAFHPPRIPTFSLLQYSQTAHGFPRNSTSTISSQTDDPSFTWSGKGLDPKDKQSNSCKWGDVGGRDRRYSKVTAVGSRHCRAEASTHAAALCVRNISIVLSRLAGLT
jgi:hypothetical protein